MRRTLLFSLLLIVGFVAGLIWRQRPEVRLTNKKPQSPFGPLEVNDSSLVCIRRGTSSMVTDYDYEPSDLYCWKLHLPEVKQWNVCWAFGEFPRDASPTTAAGTHSLRPGRPNEHPELIIWFLSKAESGWNARFGYGDQFASPIDTWLVSVPDAQGPAIWHARNSFVTAAGEESKTEGWVAQTHTGERPIVILRLGEANMDGYHGNDPYNGILVWIERVSD